MPDGREIRSSAASVRPNRAPTLLGFDASLSQGLALTFDEPMGPESGDADGYRVDPGVGRATSAVRDLTQVIQGNAQVKNLRLTIHVITR